MLRQAGLLFAIELLAHAVDYVFHLYLGRSLSAGAFAAFQSYFTLAMLFITLGGIVQPPVTRYVAAPPDTATGPAPAGAIVRAYLWQGGVVGLLVGALLMLATPLLAQATHLPAPMLRLIAIAMPLAMARPVLLGLLQGQGRFGSLGSITLLYAVARLTLAVVGIGPGERSWAASTGRAIGLTVHAANSYWAALTLPLSLVLAVALGLFLARRALGQTGRLPWQVALRGWRLSLATLLMASAFMALTGLDVVWVNRMATPEVAGAYAQALVLRRIVSFVPLATGMVLLPRVAAAGRRADRPIALAVGLVLANGTALTILYAALGGAIERLAFGGGVAAPIAWLAGMAWAMTGYGLVTIWLNVFIATEPLPFGYLLAAAAPIQIGLYLWLGRTPEAVIAILGGSGWLLALAGAALYLFWLRPRAGHPGRSALE
jgi:O-antigen/teichoic acid export membrane protein